MNQALLGQKPGLASAQNRRIKKLFIEGFFCGRFHGFKEDGTEITAIIKIVCQNDFEFVCSC